MNARKKYWYTTAYKMISFLILAQGCQISQAMEFVVLGDVDIHSAGFSGGYAYCVQQDFGWIGDISGAGQRSPLLILENGTLCGPAHSLHADIRNLGMGRFSHWNNSLYFSASDNSNPRTNGKKYQYGIWANGWEYGQSLIYASRMAGESGYCYTYDLDFGVKGDMTGDLNSILWVFENGTALGPAHQYAVDIRNSGMGRFCHLGNTNPLLPHRLYFSASDSSDPRTNGRAYTFGVVAQSDIAISGIFSRIGYSSGYRYYNIGKTGIYPDHSGAGQVSNLRLYEDLLELGPAHSLHAVIANSGMGRFSDWPGYTYFSASDNTNPLTNNRTYHFTGTNKKQVINVFTRQSPAPSDAAFSSFRKKMVKTKYGIFLAYNTAAVGSYYNWILLRSTDGGQTFTQLYSESERGFICMEVDENNSIYLFSLASATPDSLVQITRFDAADNFQTPAVNSFNGGLLGKCCTYYDKTRQRFYFMNYQQTNYDNFYIVGKNGNVIHSYAMGNNFGGAIANIQYPHLSMSEDGRLFAAWTTSVSGQYHYLSIHFAISDDGGYTWHKLDDTPLVTPFVADIYGPTDRVTMDDETNNQNWLASFIYKGNALHFMYRSAVPDVDPHFALPGGRVHYVRANLSSKTIDVNTYPLQGQMLSITGTSNVAIMTGFLTTSLTDASELLFAVSNNENKLVALASADNGKTWFDWAESNKSFLMPYHIGGAREITDDGYILGIFTEYRKTGYPFHFFKMKVASPIKL